MKTIVIGLGNPILGDDGVGWRVAESVEEKITSALPKDTSLEIFENLEIDCLSVGGLRLMERLIGFDHAIIIDAINIGEEERGTVRCLSLDEIPNRAAGHLTSSHDTTLHNAIKIGRKMGAHLPNRIDIIAIESNNIYEFSEELSSAVAESVPSATQQVIDILQNFNSNQEEIKDDFTSSSP